MLRSSLMPIAYALGIALGGVACQAAPKAPATAAPATAAPTTVASVPPRAPVTQATQPGVKPNYVKCDPAHPELPCTPDVTLDWPRAPDVIRKRPGTGDTVSALATGRSEKAIRGCATDTDCVVSCQVDGRCCGDLCQCKRTYNTTFFAEMTAHQEVCTVRCPKAKCADKGYTLKPVCKAGLCATKTVTR